MANENNSNLTEMSRDTLLYKICPWDRINGCCNGTRDYQCYDCAQLMNKWLDEYDKQIRVKAIDDFLTEICKMIVQSESNGNYRFYAVEIKQAIADIAEQLKDGGGE